MQTSMKLTLTLNATALNQLTKIRDAWGVLPESARETAVRSAHSAAVIVATGHKTAFELPAELDERGDLALRELCEQWQYLRLEARQQITAALLRTVAKDF